MNSRLIAQLKLVEDLVRSAPVDVPVADRSAVARQIAVETKRLWQEAQQAGLDDIANLMERAFYLAYQEAGGPKAMRAV